MAAKKGNNYAAGNAGGYAMPKEYREKQVELKQLVLDQMLFIMRKGTKKDKMEVIKRIGPRCIPDELELGGNPENPVRVVIVKELEHGDRGPAA